MAVKAPALPATELERYLTTARSAGCPRDQLENFLRAGIVLQPRQLAASAAARLCDHPDGPTRIGYGGARGGGKSHWAIAQAVADDMVRHPGLKFLCLRKVAKAAKEAVEDLRREVLYGVPHEWRKSEATIRLANGSRMLVGHFKNESDIDNYLGLQYDGAIIEEATQLSSAKVKSIRTCIRSSKKGWRPRTYYTTNPGGIGHAWFKESFITPLRRGQERRTRFVQATVRDNRFVNPEYREELEQLTGWLRRAWLEGDWDIAAGQYFTTFRRELHVARRRIVVGPSWRTWLALDYGFTHYTVCHLLAEHDGRVHLVDEHAERRWIVERHAQAIAAMLERNDVPAHRIKRIVAGSDVFSPNEKGGTVADDYRKHGLQLKPANDDRINGAAEILRRLGDDEVSPAIEPTLSIDERCSKFIEALSSLEHDPHRPEDVLKVDCDEDGIGGDDAYDSGRYGIMEAAARRKLKIWTFGGGSKRSSDPFGDEDDD